MQKVVYTQIRNENNYVNVISETNKKSKDRNRVSNGKGKKITPRRYHMSIDDLEELKKKYKKTGEFPNPYRENGVYNNFIEALINLGVNKSHRFADVKTEMKKIMSQKTNKKGENLWKKFINKKSSKSDLSRWDPNTRIENTAKILQRLGGLHPYGWKLRQLSACIDLLPSTDPLLPNKFNIRLNTSFDRPDDVRPVKPAHKKKNNK